MAQEQETKTPTNKVTIEDAGPCKKKVMVEIPEEKIKEAVDKQYEDLRKGAEVPGFRKGRAPRRLLEKRFGKEASEQVKLQLLAEASESAMSDNKIDALGDPDIDFEQIELPESGPLSFDFEVEVKPEFELPDLEGIEVAKTKLEVSEEQVDREVEQLQRLAGVWAPRKEDAPVEAEDQVIADVELKVEDVEEEEKLDNIEIYVRKNGFVASIPVENLDELLIGAKAGDEKTTIVEVPKTYFREEYRGKKVDVKIHIKDVKYLKPAEIDENLLNRYQAEDEEDLRDKIRDMLESRLEQQSRQEMSDQITQHLLDKTDFDLPLSVVAQQAGTLLQRQYTNLLMRGLPREQLEEQMEELKAGSEEQAIQQLKTFFIMDKVADKLKIEVTEEEINGHVAQLAMQRGQRPERLREEMARDGSLAQFGLQVRESKCISKLLESAKIVEKEPEKPKKEKKSGKKSASKSESKSGGDEKKGSKETKKQTED